MRLNIVDLLKDLGISDKLYWGKRVVRALPQPGAFKSHSIVVNWQEPEKIRIDLKAGLSGKTLNAKDLANYPLQLQSETFFELSVSTKDSEDDDGKTEKEGRAGKSSGGGGRRLKMTDDKLSGFFADAHSQKVATHARLSKGVVMGMEIAREALDGVFKQFCHQVQAAKVLASDLLATAGRAITRYTPPPFMAARGNEDKVYRYDRTKNEPMFGVAPT